MEKVKLADCEIGDVVDIGVEHKFIVFSNGSNRVGLLCQDLWLEDVEFGETSNYIGSNVQRLLNEEVLPIIETAVGSDNVLEESINLTAIDGTNNYGYVDCKVRLLTFDEFRTNSKITRNPDMPDWWWLMNPWSDKEVYLYGVAVVSPRGFINNSFYNCINGVRPFVSLSSAIFVSKE